jgi:hypothetical protein
MSAKESKISFLSLVFCSLRMITRNKNCREFWKGKTFFHLNKELQYNYFFRLLNTQSSNRKSNVRNFTSRMSSRCWCHVSYFFKELYNQILSVFCVVRSIHSRSSGRANSQHRFAEIPTIIRDMFHRSSRKKVSYFNKEMTNLSTALIQSAKPIEIISITTNNDTKHDICLVSDSPHYIVRVIYIQVFIFYITKYVI